jgi:hypothetical protein
VRKRGAFAKDPLTGPDQIKGNCDRHGLLDRLAAEFAARRSEMQMDRAFREIKRAGDLLRRRSAGEAREALRPRGDSESRTSPPRKPASLTARSWK